MSPPRLDRHVRSARPISALFRFAGGLAVGVSLITVPAYIRAIAPLARRG